VDKPRQKETSPLVFYIDFWVKGIDFILVYGVVVNDGN
jgi:hypothetical protein